MGEGTIPGLGGLSLSLTPTWAPIRDLQVSADAAGSLGYGAIFQCHWFSGSWSACQVPSPIAYKEPFLVVVAAHLWGPSWASRRVEFLCNNEAVVSILKSGTSRDPQLMAILHYLSLLVVPSSFTSSSVLGKANLIADFSSSASDAWSHLQILK